MSKLRKMNPYKHKSTRIAFTILHTLVVACMIRQAFLANYQSVFLCLLVLFLFYIPSWFATRFNLVLSAGLEVVILCFIYMAEILGEIESYYLAVPWWDTVLHTTNGFLCAAIGFSLVVLLNRSESTPVQLSPAYIALMAFCFSMTIGVLWEFLEFGGDRIFGWDSQKDTVITSFYSVELDETRTNIPIGVDGIADVVVVYEDGTTQALGLGGYLDIGLIDTMEDLFVNFVGALVFCVVGYISMVTQHNSRLVAWFVPQAGEEVGDEGK